MRTVIGGGMTPHLQLTDIMSAKMSHEFGRQWVNAYRPVLRRKALEERVAPIFKYGKRELVQMVAHIRC